MIKVTYDKEINASYIYLSYPVKTEVAKTYTCDTSEVGGMINIDFNKEGKIVGIEILDADSFLESDLLKNL